MLAKTLAVVGIVMVVVYTLMVLRALWRAMTLR